MTNQTTVKVSADASGYTAELDRARKSAEAFSATQAAAAERVRVAQQAIAEAASNGSNASSKAINNFVSQLQRTADQAGKTRGELLQMKAAQLGIADSVSGYVKQIDQASESTHGFNLSTMAARRELLVLAHEASQGNWTRFSGSLGVLAERTDALGAIMSSTGLGVGLFAAAAVAAGVDIYKTAKAISALADASNGTNGYLGLTKDQLSAMAESLASANGGLVEVSNTMAALVGSGHASADTLAKLTGVVTQFGKDSGLAGDKAAEAFIKLIEDPKKGIDELQSKYHTFSAAQIEVIEGYVKTGDTAQATKAFIDAVAESQHRMAEQGTREVGILARLWQSFSDAAKQAGDNFDRMGIATSNAEKLTEAVQRQAAAQRNLAQAKAMPFGNTASAQAELDAANAQVAAIKKVQDANQKAADENKARAKGGDAQLALTNYLNDTSHAGPAKQRDVEIAAENAKFAKLKDVVNKGSAEYQQALKDHYETIAQIEAQYAKKTKTPSNNGAINASLAQIAGQNKLIQEEEQRSQKQLKAMRDSGLIDNASYLQQLHDIQAHALDQEIALAQKRADVASGKKEKAAMETALAEVKKLTEQRAQVDADLTNALDQAQKQRADNVNKYGMQQAEILRKQADSYAAVMADMYKTPTQRSNDAQERALLEKHLQDTAQLKEQYEGRTADQTEYQDKLARLNQSFADQQTALEASLQQQQTTRLSYADQMHKAIVTLSGDGQTNAQAMADAFTSVWQTSASALDQFVTTGKGSFSQFTASVLDDMAKIALHQAEMQIFSSIGTSFFSTGGEVGHFASGGAISGAGTGTSDSIPAMLSNGEFIVNAASTKKYRSLLESINNGNTAHFATGGVVGAAPAPSSSSDSGSPVSVTVNHNGGGGLTDTDAKELHAVVSAFVERKMDQKMRGAGGYAYQIKHGMI